MRLLTILASLGLLVTSLPALAKPPAPVRAESSIFQGFHVNPVIVDDRFGQPLWSPIAVSVIASLNSVMPSTGPVFVYQLGATTCGPLDFTAIPNSTPTGHISLCQFNITGDPDYDPSRGNGYGQSVLSGDEIIKGAAYVSDNTNTIVPGILCHELLHVIFEATGQGDEHQFMAGDCVNGQYTDAARALLAQVYGTTTPTATPTPDPTTTPEPGHGPKPPKPGFCDAHPDHWKCVGALSPKHHGKHDS